MSLKIHAFPPSPRSFKVLLVANYLGLDYELRFCDLTKGAQRADAYGALNPNHKMPVLEDGDFKLWESNAMIQYLAATAPQTDLMGSGEQARADVLRWMFWEATTWDAAIATIVFERVVKGLLGGGLPDPVEVQKGLEKFTRAASILNGQLKGRAWVCLDSISLADLALASSLTMAEPARLPLDPFPEIGAWAARIAELGAWKATRAMQARPQAA